MWDYSRATLRRWAQSVLHTRDTPERTAMALGLGVAIGFSPFLGFRLAIGIAVAFLFNLNRLPGWGSRIAALDALLRPFVWAFLVGSLVGGAALGLAAYAAAKPILMARERRRLHEPARNIRRPPPRSQL